MTVIFILVSEAINVAPRTTWPPQNKVVITKSPVIGNKVKIYILVQ